MPRLRVSPFLALLAVMTAAESPAGDYPLFESEETLRLILEVPMKTLLRSAKKNPVVEGRLHYTDAGGNSVTLDITMTTRGRSRLEICSLPPLSISLKNGQTGTALFAGQKKLKIVTNCNNSSSFDAYLYQEFGIYRAYNLLTDHSFRVRMLEVTYRDIEGKRRDMIEPAFFIESDREVAERLGKTTIERKRIESGQLEPEQANIYELFQYMIGNTDWSITKGPGTEDCCHNGKVVGDPGATSNWVVLPYDFDQAGLINARYALPAEGLRIKRVTQRLYRGRCSRNEYLHDTIALFNERRGALETVLLPNVLNERNIKKARDYLDEFFVTINDPGELDKKITGACRGKKSSE